MDNNQDSELINKDPMIDKVFTFPNLVNITAVVFSIISLVFNKIEIALISLAIGLALNTALGYRYHYQFLQFKENQFKKDLENTYKKSIESIDIVLGQIQQKLEEIEEVLRQKPVIKRTNRHKMYQLATELIKDAQNKLLVVQRTPSLYFPVKTPGNISEFNFNKALENAIEKAKAGRLEVIYAFSVYDEIFKEELIERAKNKFFHKLEDEIDNIRDTNNINNTEIEKILTKKAETAKKEVIEEIYKIIYAIISDFKEIEKKTEQKLDEKENNIKNRGLYEPRLYIVSLTPETHPQPLIISDNTIAVWITDIETGKLYIKTFDYDGSRRIFDFYKNIAENFIPSDAISYLKHNIIPEIEIALDNYTQEVVKKWKENLNPKSPNLRKEQLD